MPLRILLRYLGRNEELIEKLADSRPMRQAAQIAAYMMHRGKAVGENAGTKAESFKKTLKEEMQEANKALNKEMTRIQQKHKQQ